ncbi:MAG: hypothetical protein H6598_00635 [Flavobacteriales bacterium]|nr:hypothetical protein [Flavobacteriales bacterium]
MKTIYRNKLVLAVLGVVMLASSSCRKGCTDPLAENYDDRAKKEDNSCQYDTAEPMSPINLKFTHLLGSQSFAFNQDFTDDFGNTCSFTRAEMYLSNIQFTDDEMNMLSFPVSYVLISPEETTYNIGELSGNLHVHTMNLTVGVDSVANASDPASYSSGEALAYQTPSMHWNWNSGYIFIALEGHVDLDGNGTYDSGEDFVTHVGMNSMRRTISGLMAHFNTVEGQMHNIELDIDWKQLFAGINLKTDNSTHTMDNMPLATSIADNSATAITMH